MIVKIFYSKIYIIYIKYNLYKKKVSIFFYQKTSSHSSTALFHEKVEEIYKQE